MKLRLDFTHPRPRPAPLAWLLLGLGVATLAWAGWRYQDVADGLEAENARVAALVKAAPRRPDGARARKAPGAPAESGLAATRALLATNWGALLDALEASRTPRVGLLSLDLDTARGGSLALTAEAKDPAAMLAGIDTLEALPMLEKVALVSHADVDREGEKAVRFALKARWHLSGSAP